MYNGNLGERWSVTDSTYCTLFSFWYYTAVLEGSKATDDAAPPPKECVSFIKTSWQLGELTL
jgi:hypothetical protein